MSFTGRCPGPRTFPLAALNRVSPGQMHPSCQYVTGSWFVGFPPLLWCCEENLLSSSLPSFCLILVLLLRHWGILPSATSAGISFPPQVEPSGTGACTVIRTNRCTTPLSTRIGGLTRDKTPCPVPQQRSLQDGRLQSALPSRFDVVRRPYPLR